MTIRTLVVDDEAIAIRGLCRLLQSEKDIEIIETCTDGTEAIEAIIRLQPDLVFLDIKMRNLSGFDVIDAIGLTKMPAIIFVTAFDEFAIQAFDVHAVDYLLKPIDPKRLKIAVDRARVKLSNAKDTINQQMISALSQLGMSHVTKWSKRLAIRSTGRVNLVEVNAIERIESSGNYVEIYAEKRTFLMRESLSSLEQRLNPESFVRVSRSSLVNIEFVKEMQPLFNGDFVVILKNGAQISGSRRYREMINSLID